MSVQDQPASASTEPSPGAHSHAEFVELFRAHRATLRIVATAASSQALADDVLQEAAIVGLRRFNRFRRGTDFRAWMAAIVRNTARNMLRERRRRDAREAAVAKPDQHPTASEPVAVRIQRDGVADLEGVFDAALNEALAELGEVTRACLLLRVVLDEPYAHIAAVMRIKEATARAHVHRGRTALRARLVAAGAVDSKGVPR